MDAKASELRRPGGLMDDETSQSRDVTRRASPKLPRVLPKAPQSHEVAQRLLRNSSMQPVKRFDSADYFKDLWLDQQKEKLRRGATEGVRAQDAMAPAPEAAPPPPPYPVHMRSPIHRSSEAVHVLQGKQHARLSSLSGRSGREEMGGMV